MAEYPPPTEDLPIFDNNVFVNLDEPATISDISGYFNYLEPNEIRFTNPNSTDRSILNASSITLTDGIVTNTLTKNNWSGNASSASSVSLATDDTSGTYYITFSKTTTANNNALYIDNVTGPLTYNPNSGALTATSFTTTTIATPLSSAACVLWNQLATGSITMMNNQTTGNINLGSISATTGSVNARTQFVALRQIQTTNNATYPPNAVNHLGYTIQTLGTSFTTTAIPASTNTDLMTYTFTSANFGTYMFTAHVVMVPPGFTTNHAILAISNTSLNVVTPFNDIQSPNVSTGSAYLSVTCVIPIYSVQTIYLVGFFNGSTASVSNNLSHFTYTRIA